MEQQVVKNNSRQNLPPLVGITNSYKDNETHNSKSSHGNSTIITDNSQIDNSHHDALAELIASLSNGSDNSNDSSNSANAWQVLLIFFSFDFFYLMHLLLSSSLIIMHNHKNCFIRYAG